MQENPELKQAKEVLEIEAEAILLQKDQIGQEFLETVEAIASISGKVIVTGIGKSGIVGMKIAATLASTGTPALFMHSVEGVHGDLGMLSKDDLLVAISNSGETEEVLNVVSAAGELGVRTVGISGSKENTLVSLCNHNLIVSVNREACPLGLAPTASSTAVLAMGDALAMTLSSRRRFTAEGYAAFHPGGSLGRRLKYRVRDFMRTRDNIPIVKKNQTYKDALQEMTDRENLGVVLIVDLEEKLVGILTDGDIRRFLLRAEEEKLNLSILVQEEMTPNPKVVEADTLASEALRIMESSAITSLAIVDTHSRPLGIIHLHDILGRGNVNL